MKNFLLPVLVVGLIIVTIACEKMRTIIDQLGSLRGANTENNRVWAREDSHRDKLIVFVHGFNSSNATAWGEFPSLMQKDERFEDFNLVLYGYPTKCGSVDSIREEGSSLASFLNDILEGNRPNYSRIILVGHSMGGTRGHERPSELGAGSFPGLDQAGSESCDIRNSLYGR